VDQAGGQAVGVLDTQGLLAHESLRRVRRLLVEVRGLAEALGFRQQESEIAPRPGLPLAQPDVPRPVAESRGEVVEGRPVALRGLLRGTGGLVQVAEIVPAEGGLVTV